MPSVKNPIEGTQGNLEIVNEEKDKNLHSVVFPIFEGQNVHRGNEDAVT